MAKITTNSLITGISGKVCGHDDTYFRTNRQTGRVYAVKICNPSTAAITERQQAQRDKFRAQAAKVKAWFEANPKTSETYQKTYAAYKAQHRVGSFLAYVNAMLRTPSTPGGTADGGPSVDDDL